jgi:hypothetical protein
VATPALGSPHLLGHGRADGRRQEMFGFCSAYWAIFGTENLLAAGRQPEPKLVAAVQAASPTCQRSSVSSPTGSNPPAAQPGTQPLATSD